MAIVVNNCFNAWTRSVFLFIIILGLGGDVSSQIIQYSRQNFRPPYSNTIQLVANVSGFHHILFFNQNEKVAMYVYDNELQLQSKKEVQIKLHEYDNIQVIPFQTFYYLYIHQPNSTEHELWKIDQHGNAASVTNSFMGLVETVFKKSISTLELVNRNNSLFIIANTYYDDIKKVGSSVTQADENLNVLLSRKIFFDFRRGQETLKQVTLVGDDLVILKTTRDTAGHLLQIIKANLNTGSLLINGFNSGSNVFLNPTLNYDYADSSIVISSMVKRILFLTRLDNLLNEKVPVTLVRNASRSNTAFNFWLLTGQQQKWLSMHFGSTPYVINAGRSNVSRTVYNFNPGFTSGLDNYGNVIVGNSGSYTSSYFSRRLYPSTSYYNSRYAEETSIGFSLLNTNFTLAKDSLVANNKRAYSIKPGESASVVMQNKGYLFLSQQFGSNRNGLLMVHGDNKGELSTTDIRVYDKYEYLLRQLQAVNNKYVIMPYKTKREMGLIKISFE